MEKLASFFGLKGESEEEDKAACYALCECEAACRDNNISLLATHDASIADLTIAPLSRENRKKTAKKKSPKESEK